MAENTSGPGANQSAAEAKTEAYVDPKGRKIMPRHRKMAVRRARELGLEFSNAEEALHLVAKHGVNVFANDESILDMASDQPAPAQETGSAIVPAPPSALEKQPKERPGKAMKEAMATSGEEERARREKEMARIQRDLVRRRRQRLWAMVLRLVVFVFLPTWAVGYYYVFVASDMYETNSQFVIQTSESQPGIGGLGGVLAGTGLAVSQDNTVVQGYLGSREAFLRLEEDWNFTEHFKNPKLDRLQRLPEEATLDEAYGLYQRYVTIGYDPTEGLIRMRVIASTPQASQQFSEALVEYAEDRVDGLTLEARGDQLEQALERLQDAQSDVSGAQAEIVELQQRREILSPEIEIQMKMSNINTLELEIERERLQLQEMLANPSPNQVRVDLLRAKIGRWEGRVEELRAELTQSLDGNSPLSQVSAELRMAEATLAMRQLMLQEAITSAETAQLEADRQTRYISVSVAPIAPVDATYPKKFEGTLLAFIIFSGIYILGSLTYSILREQVSV